LEEYYTCSHEHSLGQTSAATKRDANREKLTAAAATGLSIKNRMISVSSSSNASSPSTPSQINLDSCFSNSNCVTDDDEDLSLEQLLSSPLSMAQPSKRSYPSPSLDRPNRPNRIRNRQPSTSTNDNHLESVDDRETTILENLVSVIKSGLEAEKIRHEQQMKAAEQQQVFDREQIASQKEILLLQIRLLELQNSKADN
jgi:hypothetical protein